MLAKVDTADMPFVMVGLGLYIRSAQIDGLRRALASRGSQLEELERPPG